MRHTFTALISAASICAVALPMAASANVGNGNDIKAQTRQARHHRHMVNQVPSRPAHEMTRRTARTYHSTAVGVTADQTAPAGYGTTTSGVGGPFWPLTAPFSAAGSMIAAPVNAAGSMVAAPVTAAGTVATAPFYAPGPRPAMVGSCSILAGNRVCTLTP